MAAHVFFQYAMALSIYLFKRLFFNNYQNKQNLQKNVEGN